MRFRDSLAINVSPILLRLVLGVTFLWAGYGKVFTMATFTPEQLVMLDAMTSAGDDDMSEQPLEVIEHGEPDPNTDTEPFTPDAPLPEPDAIDTDGDSSALAPTPFRVILAQDSVGGDTPAPSVNERRKVNLLALMIRNAASPDERGVSLLPSLFGQGEWPMRLAWIAALTELIGGFFVLLGFLTRISALGLAFTMLTALWMTAIGPVVLFDAPSSFFFLPALDDFAIDAWRGWLWQLALLGAALSVTLSGAGALSADRILIGRRASKKAQPKAGAKPKPKAKPAFDDDDDE